MKKLKGLCRSKNKVSFPDGVKVLHDCPDARVDICFVHGLTGDRENTWTVDGQSAPWLKTLLPPRLSGARILTYGYDAYIVGKPVASSNWLSDHATNLLNDLTNDRASCHASSRPLIFVAHSLGGLVCKMAILRSRNNPSRHLRDIFKYTKGIAFMGTPHKGAWMAHWATIPASALGIVKSTNKKLLNVLETNNQFLESIQADFGAVIRELREAGRRLEVICFFEELPLPGLGLVVSQESATLESYCAVSIHANHRNMVRFDSAENTGFKRLLGELARWTGPEEAHIDSVPRSALSESLKDCLSSLAFPEIYSRSNDIDPASKGTCEWLFQHETFCRWAACDRGLLWIKGKPGSGKSTLLQHALSNIKKSPSTGDKPLILSFFFHGRGVELQRSPLGLFRSLLHQVLTEVSDALPDIVTTFQQRRDTVGEPSEKWHWHRNELQRFFESSLPKVLENRPVWLFVDALDECGERNAVDLVKEFESIVHGLPSTGLQCRICFTCRQYPVLDLDSAFDICLDEVNGQDISTYVQANLSQVVSGIPDAIPAAITDGASGVFMWARLVIERVLERKRQGWGWKKIGDEIRVIPPDLENLYQELVQSMDEKPASLKLIQWIYFATRPLSLDELRWAMVIDANCPYESLQQCQSDDEYDCDIEKRLKTLSRGLTETVLSSETLIVQFIHQSVRDFFVKGLSALHDSLKPAETETSDAGVVAGIAHYQLSRTCIRYLAMEEIAQSTVSDRDGLASTFPLLHYATTSWIAHTNQSETKVSQDDLLDYFDWPSEHLVQQWVRIYGIIDPYSTDRPPKGISMVHIVSRYHLMGPLQKILQRKVQVETGIDVKSEHGRTPLLYAAERGHGAVVKKLLEKGANPDSKDHKGWTPLMYAAGGGHEAVVEDLLAKKANINTPDNLGATALHWVVWSGNEAMISLLLKNAADIEAKEKGGGTPLAWAIETGSKTTVRMLLERGSVVNYKYKLFKEREKEREEWIVNKLKLH